MVLRFGNVTLAEVEDTMAKTLVTSEGFSIAEDYDGKVIRITVNRELTKDRLRAMGMEMIKILDKKTSSVVIHLNALETPAIPFREVLESATIVMREGASAYMPHPMVRLNLIEVRSEDYQFVNAMIKGLNTPPFNYTKAELTNDPDKRIAELLAKSQ